MLVLYLLLCLLAGTSLAAPLTPEESIIFCRQKARNSIEECACFPECKVIRSDSSYTISMGNITSSNRANRVADGCGNPSAYVTTGDNVINMGATPPFNIFSQMFQACQQFGCDPTPLTVPTIVLPGDHTLATLTTAHIVSHGVFRDWPDRDAACTIVRTTASAGPDIQYRTPYVHCRPGVDCDAPDPYPQYFQHDHYKFEHWNDCGIQAFVEVEISVDAITPNVGLCKLVVGAMGVVLSTVAPEFEWLFGKMSAVCGVIP